MQGLWQTILPTEWTFLLMKPISCKYCGQDLFPYEPGTMFQEDADGNSFSAHEVCHGEYGDPTYITADEIIERAKRETEDESSSNTDS